MILVVIGWITAVLLVLFAATVVVSLFLPGWFASNGTKRPKS